MKDSELRWVHDSGLTEAVYSTVGDPEKFPILIDQLMLYFEQLDWSRNVPAGEDLAVTDRLPMLSSLLDKLNGAIMPLTDYQSLGQLERVVVDIGASGQIIYANNSAGLRLNASSGKPCRTMELLPDNHRRLKKVLANIFSGKLVEGFSLLSDYSADDGIPTVLMMRRMTSPSGELVLRLQEIMLVWQPEIAEQIGKAYSLTGAEISVLQTIVEGKSLSRRAKDTGRSLGTLRTQLKHLLRKTQVGSQVGLTKLYAAVCLLAPMSSWAAHGQDGDTSEQYLSIPLRDGRISVVHLFGPQDGRPVMMLHGFTTGITLTDAAHAALAANNIRLIVPWRPGFGRSDAVIGDSLTQLDQFCEDISQILDKLTLKSVAIMPLTSATPFAAFASEKLGKRIEAIIGINCFVPFRTRKQLDGIPGWQKIFAGTARYFPAMLPILVKGAMQYVALNMPEKLIDGLHPPSSPDFDVAAVPEVRKHLIEGYRASFAQGTHAYEMDAQINASDIFCDVMTRIKCPCVYVYGALDIVTLPVHVAEYANENPLVSATQIAGCGHLALQSHPDDIFETVAEILCQID